MGKFSLVRVTDGITDVDKSVEAFERESLQVILFRIKSVCGHSKVSAGGLSSISIRKRSKGKASLLFCMLPSGKVYQGLRIFHSKPETDVQK